MMGKLIKVEEDRSLHLMKYQLWLYKNNYIPNPLPSLMNLVSQIGVRREGFEIISMDIVSFGNKHWGCPSCGYLLSDVEYKHAALDYDCPKCGKSKLSMFNMKKV